MFLSALSRSEVSLQCSSAGVVQSLFSVSWAEPPIPYAEVILDIGSVRGFKRKTMVTEQQ